MGAADRDDSGLLAALLLGQVLLGHPIELPNVALLRALGVLRCRISIIDFGGGDGWAERTS